MDQMTFQRLMSMVTGAFFVWLGLFILTRDPRHLRAQLAGMAMLVIAALPFGSAIYQVMDSTAESRALLGRLILAAVPIANALWCHVAITVALDVLPVRRPHWWQIAGWSVTGVGLILGIINGVAFPTVAARLLGAPPSICLVAVCLPPIASYPLYYWLLSRSISLITVIVFAISFTQAWRARHPSHAGIRWLCLASAALLLAAFALDAYRLGLVSSLPYTRLLAISMPFIGWGIAKYNALLQARVLERDFAQTLGIFTLTIITYTLLPWLLIRFLFTDNIVNGPVGTFQLALGTGAAVVTHMFIDRVRLRLDRLVSDPNSAYLRGEVAQLIQDSREGAPLKTTLAQIDLIRTRALIFENLDKQLLRELDAPDHVRALAHSPLHSLLCVRNILAMQGLSVESASEIQRAGAILTLLEAALQRLSGVDALQRPRRADQVAVLQWRIHGGVDRTEIIRRANIHPRQYDRLLQQSLMALASVVFEIERAAVSEIDKGVERDANIRGD